MLSDEQLVAIVGDLFAAGTETTATTLRWAIIYMIYHPDIQNKVQAEIHAVIGPHRLPSIKDKAAMPYSEACILEIQRMADIIPLGVPHTVTQDIVFRGYSIPKGTTIMSNLYSVHRDTDIWHKPYEFNPGRFIDDQGKIFKKEQVIPFSMGKVSILIFKYNIQIHFKMINKLDKCYDSYYYDVICVIIIIIIMYVITSYDKTIINTFR